MTAVARPDITWSCAELGMHADRRSRPDTCGCSCHTPAEGGRS